MEEEMKTPGARERESHQGRGDQNSNKTVVIIQKVRKGNGAVCWPLVFSEEEKAECEKEKREN